MPFNLLIYDNFEKTMSGMNSSFSDHALSSVLVRISGSS